MTQDQIKIASPELTSLQMKCLEGFWNRRPAKAIGADLGISEAWVNKNLAAVRRKLQVNSSAEAAAIVFGGKRESIKSYYYQETGLPNSPGSADHLPTSRDGFPLFAVARDRALINNFGVGQTIGLIFAVALGLLMGLLLMLQSAVGFQQLWKALGH